MNTGHCIPAASECTQGTEFRLTRGRRCRMCGRRMTWRPRTRSTRRSWSTAWRSRKRCATQRVRMVVVVMMMMMMMMMMVMVMMMMIMMMMMRRCITHACRQTRVRARQSLSLGAELLGRTAVEGSRQGDGARPASAAAEAEGVALQDAPAR
eukprot:1590693-Rhodomonas_salina.1